MPLDDAECEKWYNDGTGKYEGATKEVRSECKMRDLNKTIAWIFSVLLIYGGLCISICSGQNSWVKANGKTERDPANVFLNIGFFREADIPKLMSNGKYAELGEGVHKILVDWNLKIGDFIADYICPKDKSNKSKGKKLLGGMVFIALLMVSSIYLFGVAVDKFGFEYVGLKPLAGAIGAILFFYVSLIVIIVSSKASLYSILIGLTSLIVLDIHPTWHYFAGYLPVIACFIMYKLEFL